MSIATALEHAQERIENAYSTIDEMGGTIPATPNLANLSTAISSIPAGGSYTAGTGIVIADDVISVGQQDTVNDYTNVGTLTITNGVASGFAVDNYLYKDITWDTTKNWELVVPVTDSDPNNTDGASGILYYSAIDSASTFGFRLQYSYGKIYFRVYDDTNTLIDSVLDGVITADVKTYVKVTYDTTDGYAVALSTDNSTWTTVGTIASTTTMNSNAGRMYIGTRSTNTYPITLGTLYLGETYIKSESTYVWRPYIAGESIAKATNSLYGVVKPDGTTITINDGVISSANLIDDTSTTSTTKTWSANKLSKISYGTVSENCGVGTSNPTDSIPGSIGQHYLNTVSKDAFMNVNGYSKNFNIIGNPTIVNGIVSGFSNNDYLTLPTTFNPGNNPFEIMLKAKISSHSNHPIFTRPNTYHYGIVIEFNTNSFYYMFSSQTGAQYIFEGNGTNSYELNTWYYLKIEWTGTVYNCYISTDKETWVLDKTCTSSESIVTTSDISSLGYHPGKGTYLSDGSIDLSECYIKVDGVLWWKPVEITGTNNWRKVPTIPLSTTGKFLRDDGTWQTVNTSISSSSYTIETTDWSNNTASISIPGVTASSDVFVSPGNTLANMKAYAASRVFCSSIGVNRVTMSCETTPEENITVIIGVC